jgi:hypothetical protein
MPVMFEDGTMSFDDTQQMDQTFILPKENGDAAKTAPPITLTPPAVEEAVFTFTETETKPPPKHVQVELAQVKEEDESEQPEVPANGAATKVAYTGTGKYDALLIRLSKGVQEVDVMLLRKLLRVLKETAVGTAEFEGTWGAKGEYIHTFFHDTMALLQALKAAQADVSVKEYALMLVRQTILTQGAYCNDQANDAFLQLIAYRLDSVAEIAAAADSALDVFAKHLDKDACLDAILGFISGQEEEEGDQQTYSSMFAVETSPLVIALTCLAGVLARFQKGDLEQSLLDSLISMCMQKLNDHIPEIRKSSLDVLVALNKLGEEAVQQAMSTMTVAQQKLLESYIE